MRKIGEWDNEREAQHFADFLLANGIGNQIEQESSGRWAVWGHRDEQRDEAAKLLDRFQQGLGDTEQERAAREAEARRQEESRKESQARANLLDLSARWRSEAFLSRGVAPLTAALMVASIGVALLSGLGARSEPLRRFFITEVWLERGIDGREYFTWNRGLPEIRRGELWRLVTPIFIHFGLLHIVFNMLWLKDLGSLIERKRGWGALAIVVLGTGITANLAQYVWSGPAFGGMSGVVYGLLGYSWIRGKYDLRSGLFVDRRHIVWMGMWLVVCMTGMMGPIGNAAHLVGLLGGMAWGFVTSGTLGRWWANYRAQGH